MSLNASTVVDIVQIVSPTFIGILFTWGFFGILSIQVYQYFQSYPDDKPALKALVGGIYILEASQMCMLSQTAWKLFVSGFGDLEKFNEIGTTWLSVCCIGGLTGFVVQWFYAYRLFVLTRNRIISGCIVLVCISLLASIHAMITSSSDFAHFTGRSHRYRHQFTPCQVIYKTPG
ncbi:hypothetical protein BDN70DRAFT_962606 [Pholiota conissans]|uniref:Uncharacterized protein n=1 Tax=Pholiota conissans TaxID=109636 RepID=A0A9P5ZAH3_9AGAR|nr:hypothetical protein BDN70DRAFT_962606 [Pholiota conissans]